MKIESLLRFPITPGPWAPRRSHEDANGPMFDIDPDEREAYEVRPFTSIISQATGGNVVIAHDLFTFRNEIDAKAIAKVPELLQIAIWAEAALGYLATTAAPDLRPEFGRRSRETSAVLNEIRSAA